MTAFFHCTDPLCLLPRPHSHVVGARTSGMPFRITVDAHGEVKVAPGIYEMRLVRRPWLTNSPTVELPLDVVRLVMAARRVVETQDRQVLRELHAASEAFASLVPWDDDPNDEPEAA